MSTKQEGSESDYDALLVVSFGGPEGMDDVIPFLENVLRGRNVPRERLLEVAHHYEQFGGVSPINGHNRKLIAALKDELKTNGPDLSVYWGNRNWHPMLANTVQQMADDGIKRALAFVTSAYSSYSSCRQYLENIAEARAQVGPAAPRIEKLRPFFNHPVFIAANTDHIRAALGNLNNDSRQSSRLVFTAHSIPESMAANCDYEAQLKETGRLIAARLGIGNWELAYQSRSGSPAQPWLGPDICDHLKQLAAGGVTDVVVAPIGFVSDHMEVIYDLDVEAKRISDDLGVNMIRAATAGTHPSFIKMVRELILEKMDGEPLQSVGDFGPRPHACSVDCCLPRSLS